MSLTTTINEIYAQQSRAILAPLIRAFGDFDAAEEAMHEAFAAALSQWPAEGLPDNPKAWLLRTARNKGIDQIRRRQSAAGHATQFAYFQEQVQRAEEQLEEFDDVHIADDQLRLIFICCHPSLPTEAQLALTLREVCRLTTEQVARALLQQSTTVAQRIVRAKRKIRDEQIPYELPEPHQRTERLQSVLHIIYLIFNEGYSSSSGAAVVNADLVQEAIRLNQQLLDLSLANRPQRSSDWANEIGEIQGLLALLLLQDSRRPARQTADGDLIRLSDQNRNLWNQPQIQQGLAYLQQALAEGEVGEYTIQAAIAAVHATAATADATDWHAIVGWYNKLLEINASPIVALNRAVAVAMADGPTAGLALLDELRAHKAVLNYHLFHAAYADLANQAGRPDDALLAYQRALSLAQQEPERRFLNERIQTLLSQN